MKKLREILQNINVEWQSGDIDIDISEICFDSRKVRPGSIFIATRGTQVDGHEFIPSAVSSGVVAIVCDKIPLIPEPGITYLKVRDTTVALGQMASSFYGNPSAKLKLVGITGTNGKTTTATLLYSLFRRDGYKTGLLSTVINYIDDLAVASTHTTPDSLHLNHLLYEMVEAGCEFCFMEVSSHAIVQNRIEGLNFAGAVFTNITHDHLDYHRTFDEYLKAKKLFFDTLPAGAFALTNNDDRNGRIMVQNTIAKKYTYALKSNADFKCRILEKHFEGMLLSVNDKEVWTRLIGGFNAYNALAVFSTAKLSGLGEEEILTLLSSLEPVDGRFQTMRTPGGITIIVDYAHTPDAIKNVLLTINELRTGNEQLITVIGAGGDRDKGKRPKMARIAAELSNIVILTSDNPRNENPELIISEMIQGVDLNHRNKIISIVNRSEAIKAACLMAHDSDILLIAGKGHETYQEVKGVKSHFDDREEVRKNLEIISQ